MRISLTQTILLSTALLTMNLPLTAMEDTAGNENKSSRAPIVSAQPILCAALGFTAQESNEAIQTIITRTSAFLSLENTIKLNEMYIDYTTLPTQTSLDQEITATALRTITQMQPCDFTWHGVNDPEENAANESVIDAIYPLTSSVESTENLALKLDRIAYLNATYTIFKKV